MLSEDETKAEIGNYFRSNLLTLRNAIRPQDFKKFTALSSNAERVAFVLSYPEAHHLSLEVENAKLKDAENALKLKEAGNKLFARGDFRNAAETYSNAALLAPRNELGVILANRSACLYHLEQYDYALRDIKEAIQTGYPKELMYKLEERRARCLLARNRLDEAIDSFKAALKGLDASKLPLERKQKLDSDIRIMLALMSKSKEMTDDKKKKVQKPRAREVDSQIPRLEHCNPLYPEFSDAVEIKDDGGDAGRYAVATRDIMPGEILAVEKPHCAFLLAEYRLTHCHRCFARNIVPLPAACNRCSSVAYCSLLCRNADAKVHSRECILLPALWLSKASITCFLALRAILQRSFKDLMNLRDKLKVANGTFEISIEHVYKGENYETLHGLVTHESERSSEDIFHRAYIASWLLRLLKTCDYIPDKVKTPDTAEQPPSEVELFVADLLLHNLQVAQFNSHEISELVRPKCERTLAKAKSVFIGGGIYPTVALINHSCNPGIIRYFIGNVMIIRAIRTIPAGEEVADNYGPIFTTVPEVERKRKMRLQYWFDCNCEACKNHWPLLEDIDPTILRFKCETGPSCGNILPIRTNSNEFMINCPKCGKSTNILKGLKALQDTDALFKVASRHLEDGEHEQALNAYIEILKLLDETLALPIRDYHLCQEGVRLCLLTLGNNAMI